MLPGLWVDRGGVYFRLWVWQDRLQVGSQVQVDSKCVDPRAQGKGQWPCRGGHQNLGYRGTSTLGKAILVLLTVQPLAELGSVS